MENHLFKTCKIEDILMPLRVIIDSNFLMIPAQFKIDIYEELDKLLGQRVQTIIPSPIYQEIKRISEGKSLKMRSQANIALTLATKSQLVNVNPYPKESVDDLLVRLAKKWNCAVATNDTRLRARLRQQGIPTIYLRQRSHLAMDRSFESSLLDPSNIE